MSPIRHNLAHIAHRFNQAAPHYDRHALVQQEAGRRLLARLDCAPFSPHTILDIGSGTGFLTQALCKRFPNSTVIGLDLAYNMLRQASRLPTHAATSNLFYLCGNMQRLPFKDQSFDLIFSNFTFQWASDLPTVFAECKRLLSPIGKLFFTTLGPDTLCELRQSFAEADKYQHIHPFYDLHDIGDMLFNGAFQDPVVDKENITLCYDNVLSLLQDLKGVGSSNLSSQKNPGCMTVGQLKKVQIAYERYKDPAHFYPATYEIIYGHALSPTLHQRSADGMIHIPGHKIPVMS